MSGVVTMMDHLSPKTRSFLESRGKAPAACILPRMVNEVPSANRGSDLMKHGHIQFRSLFVTAHDNAFPTTSLLLDR